MDRFTESLNTGCEKPLVPKLPKTMKELNALLKKGFKVLRESEPVSVYGGEYRPGEVAISNVELECPFCRMKFKATRSSGCFLHKFLPNTCPNCHFPNNTVSVVASLLKKRKNSKVFNKKRR